MTVHRTEIGLVSSDDTLVKFFATVFDLEELPVITASSGLVYRLQGPGTAIKVMVPARPPEVSPTPASFLGATGIRYLTLYVSDLETVTERVLAGGGSLQHGPIEMGPGARLSVFHDPDGNTLEVVQTSPQPS